MYGTRKIFVRKILQLKQEYPKAKVLAHPECTQPILMISDYIGSTSNMLEFSKQDSANEFVLLPNQVFCLKCVKQVLQKHLSCSTK